MSTIIAFTGDLHVNSTVAVCPPTVELDDGGQYHASRPQQWLWERWLEYWAEVRAWKKREKAQVLTVVNGEAADDNHHATTQLISKNPEDQARASLAVMEPLQAASDRIVFTRGTEAHSGTNAHVDEKLAKAVGADPDGSQYARWRYRDVIEGVKIDVAHHPGTGHARPWTRGGDANRLAQMIMADYIEREMLPPDLAVRGHNHKPSDSADNHVTRAVVLPSWQVSTSFGHRLGGQWLPNGSMLMLVDDGQVVRERKMFSKLPIADWGDL